MSGPSRIGRRRRAELPHEQVACVMLKRKFPWWALCSLVAFCVPYEPVFGVVMFPCRGATAAISSDPFGIKCVSVADFPISIKKCSARLDCEFLVVGQIVQLLDGVMEWGRRVD